MTWATLADLASKATRNTFGVSVSYTPTSTGIAESIVAPFEAAFAVQDGVDADGQPIISVRPVLDVRLAEPAPQRLECRRCALSR